MVVCAFPDISSHVLGVVRDWSIMVWVGFHCLTLFHRQWVIYALNLWLTLGVVIAYGAARLHGGLAIDPYCNGYIWSMFPMPTIVSLWIIVGWGLWYCALWRRPVDLHLLAVGLALGVGVPVLLVMAHITHAWQAVLSALLGAAWAGILAGAIRLGGHLVWGHVRHSTFIRALRMRQDTWTRPPPPDPGFLSVNPWSCGERGKP